MKTTKLAMVFCCSAVLTFALGSVSKSDQVAPDKVSQALKRISPIQQYSYIGPLRREDYNEVSSVIEAGRSLDHSQVPFIIGVLQSPPHVSYATAGLHALAKMGALEGLPVVQTYIDTDTGDTGKYAVVVKARLLAENSVSRISSGPQKAVAKVERFYKELNMTSGDMNNALIAFHTPNRQQGAEGRASQQFSTLPPQPPIGVYAMRELADMVYNGSYQDYASLPQVASVNFQEDYPSALKMRLAALPHEERLNTIIDELANKKALTPDDSYELQLAINEGKPASRLAAQKLADMESHHDQYASAGFSALFSVLSGVGNQEEAPILARFLNVTYPYVSHYAKQDYRSLIDGNRGEYIVGY